MSSSRSSKRCLPVRQLLPRQDRLVDAHHQHLLVPGPVVDADLPACRQREDVAAQEILVQFHRVRRLEARDMAALGIDAGEDMLDRAVLPRRVHRLEDAEHRPAILRVELVLHRRERLHATRQQLRRAILVEVEPGGVVGLMVAQAEAIAILHAEAVQHLLDGLVHVAILAGRLPSRSGLRPATQGSGRRPSRNLPMTSRRTPCVARDPGSSRSRSAARRPGPASRH
jgi:hypothetical protein